MLENARLVYNGLSCFAPAIQQKGHEMTRTVFDTPVLSALLSWISTFLLAISGWKIQGHLPDLPKFVLIAAPHTSNWDFIMMLVTAFAIRTRIHWMGKDSLFRRPFGAFFKWCGGIPIDRSKPNGTVGEMTRSFVAASRLILVIAPEGTRGQVRQWKTGFYHIARSARVPIVPGFLDFGRKLVGFGEVFTPGENIETDMGTIQAFYAGMLGKNVSRTSALKPVEKV
jgi:1-acyl-sn-glycerol-3-phosphate acyltransferase